MNIVSIGTPCTSVNCLSLKPVAMVDNHPYRLHPFSFSNNSMWLSQLFLLFLCFFSCISALSPNEKLIKCCRTDPQIDSYCANKYCQIPMISAISVVPFITECANRGKTVQKIWDCVSSRKNHSGCCRNQGVIPHCMPYCNAVGPVPTDMVKYGICIGEFEKFRVCFRTYLKHNKSIRGD